MKAARPTTTGGINNHKARAFMTQLAIHLQDAVQLYQSSRPSSLQAAIVRTNHTKGRGMWSLVSDGPFVM
eukprot:6142694-Amphidinium_carterae.2